MNRREFFSVTKAVAAAALTLAVCVLAFGQSVPPSAPAAQSDPSASVLRVASRLVQVDVSVLDKDGNPVTGLTKDDFTILDQGQRQQTATFSAQVSRVVANAAAPNVFSNRDTPPVDSQPPLTVIVMDVYNSRLWDVELCPTLSLCAVGPMFEAVKKFINQMQPQDRVALYVADEVNLYLLQDFTSDPVALRRGLKRGEWYVPANISPWRAGSGLRTPRTMQAMRTISTRLKNVPGRKNIIWISSGFPAPPSVAESVIGSVKTLGDGAMPLSAIDPLGLVAPVPGTMNYGHVPGPAKQGMQSGAGFETPGSAELGLKEVGSFHPLAQFALATGGSAISGTNDIAGAIQRVVDRNSNTYLLGYYPDHNKWNGEFREIKVRVNRPGVEVHARLGYYASTETGSAPQLTARRLADVVRSPLDASDLTFDIRAESVGVAGERQLKLEITFDPTQLHFQQQSERWMDNITEVRAEFGPEGSEISRHSQTLNLSPPVADYEQFRQKPFSYSETVTISKSADRLRIVLRDENTGALGSVTIPLSKLFPEGPEQARPRN
jgi:VWFA-related protein